MGCGVLVFSVVDRNGQLTAPAVEKSIFWEVTVSAILSKTVDMYICPIPNCFRDIAISLYSTLHTVTPCPHTSCKVH
jgi:hypothetical protein